MTPDLRHTLLLGLIKEVAADIWQTKPILDHIDRVVGGSGLVRSEFVEFVATGLGWTEDDGTVSHAQHLDSIHWFHGDPYEAILRDLRRLAERTDPAPATYNEAARIAASRKG